MPPTSDDLDREAEELRRHTAELRELTELRREARAALLRLAGKAIPAAEQLAVKLAMKAIEKGLNP